MSKYIWMSGDYGLTKVGYDTNGNWSYWISSRRAKRAVKVQHGTLGSKGSKVTERVIRSGMTAMDLLTLNDLVEYYKKNHEKNLK
jgi:hypothetical protein